MDVKDRSSRGLEEGRLVIPIEDELSEGRGPLPGAWRGEVEARLEEGERPLIWFAPDLDNRLHYETSLVVLTDRRLLHVEPSGELTGTDGVRSWRVAGDLELRTRDRAGVGTLELIGPSG